MYSMIELERPSDSEVSTPTWQCLTSRSGIAGLSRECHAVLDAQPLRQIDQVAGVGCVRNIADDPEAGLRTGLQYLRRQPAPGRRCA
jgi:hypothetical protein